MNEKIKNILNYAIKYAQSVGLEAADIQVALGQDEKAGTFRNAGGSGYYAQDKINAIITDFCNRFNISDDTNGTVNINYNNGAISFIVNLNNSDETRTSTTVNTAAKKGPAIAKYLQAKFAADMAKKISFYLKSKGKAPAGSLVVGWLKF